MILDKTYRLGTRQSPLALWQAEYVKKVILEHHNVSVKIINHKSEGDIDLKSEIHKISKVGVFSDSLNQKILNNHIDFAVHSLKDLPTEIDKELCLISVVGKRQNKDVLVSKKKLDLKNKNNKFILATGSIRRKSQWLNSYPNSNVVGLRGNIAKRLSVLENKDIDAIIMAEVALERLNVSGYKIYGLNFTSAPAQGLLGIVSKKNNIVLNNILSSINNKENYICAKAERMFMKKMEGGCSAPIGAFCYKKGTCYYIKVELISIDGKLKLYKEGEFKSEKEMEFLINGFVKEINKKGGKEIMKELDKQKNDE